LQGLKTILKKIASYSGMRRHCSLVEFYRRCVGSSCLIFRPKDGRRRLLRLPDYATSPREHQAWHSAVSQCKGFCQWPQVSSPDRP